MFWVHTLVDTLALGPWAILSREFLICTVKGSDARASGVLGAFTEVLCTDAQHTGASLGVAAGAGGGQEIYLSLSTPPSCRTTS